MTGIRFHPASAGGPSGPPGPEGSPGVDGIDGVDGPPGPPGATGPQGSQGGIGPAGSTGATGNTGAQGQQGPQGNAGAQGSQGIQGIQGPAGPPASNVVYVHKTALQSNATTTLADVTGMSFPVAANTTYLIEYYVFAFAALATTGLALALNGPAIGTGYLRYGMYATPTATTHFAGGATVYETKVISTGVISTTLPTLHILYGYLANGATAGTVQLRMASELAASVTIERGSWGRITQV